MRWGAWTLGCLTTRTKFFIDSNKIKSSLVIRMNLDWNYTPLQIAVLYFILGTAALFFFDVVLLYLLDDDILIRQIQGVKGGIEVLVTAIFIYFLTKKSRSSLQDINKKLEERGKALEVMNRVLRHNVRNDVNIVLGYADMLGSKMDNDKLDTITRVTSEISEYTGKAEKIKEVMQETGVTEIELHGLIDKITESAGREYDAEIEVDIEEGTYVVAHKKLEHGLKELVENALEHNDSGDPTVRITAEDTGAEIRLSIMDNGPGIPEHEQRILQEGVETPLRHTSGIGLWLCYWVVHESQGRMRIRDNEPRGSIVDVYLPKQG